MTFSYTLTKKKNKAKQNSKTPMEILGKKNQQQLKQKTIFGQTFLKN